MVIRQFLNFNKKKIDDKSDKIVEKIAKAYSIENKTHKTDEQDIVISRLSYTKAFQAL